MAISFDATGHLNGGVGSVLTWTHTVGAGVTKGIVNAYVFDGGTDTPTGMSFNGTAMTLLKSGTQTGDPISGQFWYFLNPPTGLGTFKGTYSGTPSGGEYDAFSVSYGGVNQNSPYFGSAFQIGTNGTSGSVAFTSLPPNAWSVGMVAFDNNTGTTKIGNQRGTAGNGAMVIGADNTTGTLQFTNSNTSSNSVVIGGELRANLGLIQSSGTSALGLGSTSAVWANNTTTGNLVVVGVTLTNATTLGTVTSITDTQNNTYTKAVGGTKASGIVSVLDEEIWYAVSITGGAGSVIVNHTVDNCALFVREYNGYNTLDVVGSAIGSSATPNTGTVSTNFGTELLVVATGDDHGAGQTYTVAGNYIDMVGTTTTLTGVSMEDSQSGGAAAQTGTLTFGNSADWVSLFASFYQAAGVTTLKSGYISLLGVGQI